MAIDQKKALRLFSYDPETGSLSWKQRPRSDFKSLRAEKAWNAKYAGKEAGYIDRNGYRTVAIDNRHYFAHRLIWLMVHGQWPDQIDHIEGNRADNRLHMIREVNETENKRNMAAPRTNTSGCVGVIWRKNRRRWQAGIVVANKLKYLGNFKSKTDAIACRKQAERDLGFHENHGRFA